MTCDECAEHLLDFVRDMCEPKDRQLVEEHLKECPKCSSEVEQAKAMLGLLSETLNEEVKEGVDPSSEKVIAKARTIYERRVIWNRISSVFTRPTTHPLGWATAVATIVLILLLYPRETHRIPAPLVQGPALGELEPLVEQSSGIAQFTQKQIGSYALEMATLGPDSVREKLLARYRSILPILTMDPDGRYSLDSAGLVLETSPGLVLASGEHKGNPFLASLRIVQSDSRYRVEVDKRYLLLSREIFHDPRIGLTLFYVPALSDGLLSNQVTSGHLTRFDPPTNVLCALVNIHNASDPLQVESIELSLSPAGVFVPAFSEDNDTLERSPHGALVFAEGAQIVGIVSSPAGEPNRILPVSRIQEFISTALNSVDLQALTAETDIIPLDTYEVGPDLELVDSQGTPIDGASVRFVDKTNYIISLDGDNDGKTDLSLSSSHPGFIKFGNWEQANDTE